LLKALSSSKRCETAEGGCFSVEWRKQINKLSHINGGKAWKLDMKQLCCYYKGIAAQTSCNLSFLPSFFMGFHARQGFSMNFTSDDRWKVHRLFSS
jgi:hypothetical protein